MSRSVSVVEGVHVERDRIRRWRAVRAAHGAREHAAGMLRPLSRFGPADWTPGLDCRCRRARRCGASAGP